MQDSLLASDGLSPVPTSPSSSTSPPGSPHLGRQRSALHVVSEAQFVKELKRCCRVNWCALLTATVFTILFATLAVVLPVGASTRCSVGVTAGDLGLIYSGSAEARTKAAACPDRATTAGLLNASQFQQMQAAQNDPVLVLQSCANASVPTLPQTPAGTGGGASGGDPYQYVLLCDRPAPGLTWEANVVGGVVVVALIAMMSNTPPDLTLLVYVAQTRACCRVPTPAA